jgi:hypothetical protein
MHWYLAIIVNPAKILQLSEPPIHGDPPRTRSALGTDRRPFEASTGQPSSSPQSETKDDEPPAHITDDFDGPRPPEIRVVSAATSHAQRTTSSSSRMAQAWTDGTPSPYFTHVGREMEDVGIDVADDIWAQGGADAADRVTASTSQLTLHESPPSKPQTSRASSSSSSFSDPNLLWASPSKSRAAGQETETEERAEAMDVEDLGTVPTDRAEPTTGEASSPEGLISQLPDVPTNSADETEPQDADDNGSATTRSTRESFGQIDPKVDPEGCAD